jgi:hypothetical protein
MSIGEAQQNPAERIVVIPEGQGWLEERMVWLDFYVGTPAAYLKTLRSP